MRSTICSLGIIKSQLHLQSQTGTFPKQQLTRICPISRAAHPACESQGLGKVVDEGIVIRALRQDRAGWGDISPAPESEASGRKWNPGAREIKEGDQPPISMLIYGERE